MAFQLRVWGNLGDVELRTVMFLVPAGPAQGSFPCLQRASGWFFVSAWTAALSGPGLWACPGVFLLA